MNEISFESLDYGAYILNYDSNSVISENVKYATAEFNKLYVRKVRLPEGKGNIVYLLSDTFENSLRMTQNQNFFVPPTYRKLHYPWISIGQFMGRRYKFSLVKERANRIKLIKDKTRFNAYPTRHLQRSTENVVVSTADFIEQLKPLIQRLPIRRCFMEFFKEFDRLITEMTPEIAKEYSDPGWNNRLLIIDAEAFAFKNGAPLEENKTNPLFLFYLAFLRTKDLTLLDVDRDMMICAKNMFIKFNPARLDKRAWPRFKMALFKIMNMNLDNYVDQISDEEKSEIEVKAANHITQNIIDNTLKPYTRNISTSTKEVLKDAVGASVQRQILRNQTIAKTVQQEQEAIAKSINPSTPKSLFKTTMLGDPKKSTSITKTNPYDPVSKKRMDLFNAIVKDYGPLTQKTNLSTDEKDIIDEYEDDIADDVSDAINEEDVIEEVLDEIQDKKVPLKDVKSAPINSARDKKLREEQKKVVVQNSTIEEILERDSSNVPIKAENKSKVLKTCNQNMHNINFANFDKTYIEELYVKDILGCFDMLKDKESPFYIRKVDIKDTSDVMNYKDTWTVKLVDEDGKSHTIKVDIPKFYDNRFMYIQGNKYIILKQNFYNPIVKDTPDTCIITTNYFKVTLRRRATRSLSTIERIFSLQRKTGDTETFVPGDAAVDNIEFISSLEYDELSKKLFKFKSNNCEIYFSRKYLQTWLESKEANKYRMGPIKGNEFVIGVENGTLIVIDEDTGRDRQGRTIADIMEANLNDDLKAVFNSIKPPKQSMYVESKLAGQMMPVGAVLIVWVGISKMLDAMGMKWEFHTDIKRMPQQTSDKKYVRFSDGILEYEAKTFAELILNGLTKLNTEKHTFEEFNTEEGYLDYLYSIWGSYKGILEVKTFYNFLMDHITKEVCRDYMLPTDPVGLMIHAVKLLCDNTAKAKADDTSYRVRSIETIPAILYSCIANQYKSYISKGGRTAMSLDQKVLINTLLGGNVPTVKAYSTLNPAIEVGEVHTITPKGYRGSNSDYSYDEKKRSYHPTAVGKIAISSSPDAKVGVNRELVVEPTITNARGYRAPVEDLNDLKDVNVFSPVELLTPGTARNDDPIRTAIAGKQSQHLVPVENASPTLVTNGFDEALQFHLSSDFVINAEEDGKVIEIDPETGFTVVEYKSGKRFAFTNKPEIVKNSGGGFYMSNQLKAAVTKVGQTFKKDEVLAYHDKYFKYSKLNGLRYAIGPLVKMAFMSSYNTYEDAGICTAKLAEQMKTRIVYLEPATFKKESNIIHIAKIGDHVGIGDVLIRYDNAFEDADISKYLTKLSDENRKILEEETKNDIKSHHAGTIIDIKVYTLVEPSNLSPSLGKIVQSYFDRGLNKKKFLEKHDSSSGIVKAGYMLTDNTEPLVTRYNTIKKYKGIDVLIEFYIEHADVMGVGDKVALYGPNKQIISEVIPEGFEPYSEFRKDEEISVLTSPGTIARRMTPAVQRISAATKVLIELKRKIAEEIKYK